MTKYPSVLDPYFEKKISKKFSAYKIPNEKKSFDKICFPKKYELQVPQMLLAEYINPKTPYKDLLIFHKIGAGKTCTAINIAEKWKKERKIIVAVPASLIENFRSELRSLCAKDAYLKDNERSRLSILHPTDKEYLEIIKKSDDRIDKVYSIYSYQILAKLIEQNKLNLNKKVLIVDEIQNMVSSKGKYYSLLHKAIHNGPSDLRVILLSATPIFDKPVEIALTLNLLRLPKSLPIGKEFDEKFIKNSKSFLKSSAKNLDKFKDMIRGYVSYYGGAPPYVFPESDIKFVKCEMSEFQYKSYLTVLAKEGTETNKNLQKMEAFHTGGIMKLPNSFFIGSRMISNVAFPNKGIEEDGFQSLKKSKLADIETYSSKMTKVLKKIKVSGGPVFIYSNFSEYGGLKSLIEILEKDGYSDYFEKGEGRKRYALWTGKTEYKKKGIMKAVFNQQSNSNGSKLKIILGSPSTKEGISFSNVQQVHIIEPYWNYSRLLQIIGRAVRYCSHKNLPPEKRLVKVFVYLATHPYEEMTIDEYIMKLALKKNKIISEFETALKEVAVDCELFKNGNVFSKDENIKCVN